MSLAIISFDAVSTADLEFLGTLEHFPRLCSRGTLVDRVDSVFVSNTYPAHCSVITGNLPARHGVIENTVPNPGLPKAPWYCRRSDISGTTLYDEARKAGRKTCAIFWPVTGGADIYKNMPEVVAPQGVGQVRTSLALGSKLFQIKHALRRGIELRGLKQPHLDNFSTHCAVDSAKNKDFDLLLLHLIDVDSHKHHFGTQSPQAREALRRMDERLGRLMKAYDGWDFIVFGDHGCKDLTGFVNLNDHWTLNGSFWHLAGGCAFLRVTHGSKQEALEAARALIANPDCHVGREISEEEMKISGLCRDFVLGLEAAEGYGFTRKHYAGNHGFSLRGADDRYKVFYLAAGEKIGQGKRLSGGCITDIAPLAAHMLGLELWDMDGAIHEGILNQ